MKRSEVNAIIKEAIEFFSLMKFKLPPYAFYSIEDWKAKRSEIQEILDLNLGWDITDFGSGNFAGMGLVLFTLRNGILNDTRYTKPYAEKIMVVREKQVTPMHFHWHKMEDIINRGGGNLLIELHNSTTDNKLADTEIEVVLDGHLKYLKAGSIVRLEPGDSICLAQGLYHTFWSEEGKGNVLVGEVSMINDDSTDNCFLHSVGRFASINEDVKPSNLLAADYKNLL